MGIAVMEGYGATECAPIITTNRGSSRRVGSVGTPLPGQEIRIAEDGEVQTHGPNVFRGYWQNEAATAAAFDDGWYRTGDVGWLEPEGWVHLTDRSKEMIKVNGFQVAPAEIEAILHAQPSVRDCAVFGVPDERAGEVPVAAVQLDPASAVTEDELKQVVADSLATYKQLRRVVFVESVPRLPSGKVLRRVLRDQHATAVDA
jgi:acyl-CoA synthetase (AMP-forming)/AMP-acid ligase II